MTGQRPRKFAYFFPELFIGRSRFCRNKYFQWDQYCSGRLWNGKSGNDSGFYLLLINMNKPLKKFVKKINEKDSTAIFAEKHLSFIRLIG